MLAGAVARRCFKAAIVRGEFQIQHTGVAHAVVEIHSYGERVVAEAVLEQMRQLALEAVAVELRPDTQARSGVLYNAVTGRHGGVICREIAGAHVAAVARYVEGVTPRGGSQQTRRTRDGAVAAVFRDVEASCRHRHRHYPGMYRAKTFGRTFGRHYRAVHLHFGAEILRLRREGGCERDGECYVVFHFLSLLRRVSIMSKISVSVPG